MRTAASEEDAVLRERFQATGLPYPPYAILLRAFKREASLDLLACSSCPQPGQVHLPIEIFPARLTDAGFRSLATTHRNQLELVSLWSNLKEGYEFFEGGHVPPHVTTRNDGSCFQSEITVEAQERSD